MPLVTVTITPNPSVDDYQYSNVAIYGAPSLGGGQNVVQTNVTPANPWIVQLGEGEAYTLSIQDVDGANNVGPWSTPTQQNVPNYPPPTPGAPTVVYSGPPA